MVKLRCYEWNLQKSKPKGGNLKDTSQEAKFLSAGVESYRWHMPRGGISALFSSGRNHGSGQAGLEDGASQLNLKEECGMRERSQRQQHRLAM